MKYEFITPKEKEIEELIELSRLWVKEDCSYGMVENTADDISEPLLVARDKGKIIGYIFGHPYIQEKKTSYIESGSNCFFVDELYVLKEYRSLGIGKNLFKIYEKQVCKDYDYYTLSTSTKNYRRILSFYVDELGMDFHSAFLIKKTNS